MRPELLESVDVTAGDFSGDREQRVFEAISALWETDRLQEIPLGLLVDKLPGDGAASYFAGLVDGSLKLDPSAVASLVRELRDKRTSIEIVRASKALAEEHLRTGAFDEDGFRRLTTLIERRGKGQSSVNIRDVLLSGASLQSLEVDTDWTVENVQPARSIGMIHAPGGSGKTYFSLGMGGAVDRGEPFLGLATKQRPVVYVDFENPLPLLVERARKLDIRSVMFWHLSAAVPPPKLDSANYKQYFQLPAGALLIFDTLRAAHDGDENSSKDMALVMGRLKEIRERGFDIFLNHHTPKANDRSYKGSTAISDLADHVLKLYRSRPGSLEELSDDDEPDPGATFVLATGKTRFEPFHMYLSFDPENEGFRVADDPNRESLDAIAEYVAGPGRGEMQTEIVKWAKSALDIGRRERILSLLRRGEREGRWHTRKEGRKLHYEP